MCGARCRPVPLTHTSISSSSSSSRRRDARIVSADRVTSRPVHPRALALVALRETAERVRGDLEGSVNHPEWLEERLLKKRPEGLAAHFLLQGKESECGMRSIGSCEWIYVVANDRWQESGVQDGAEENARPPPPETHEHGAEEVGGHGIVELAPGLELQRHLVHL